MREQWEPAQERYHEASKLLEEELEGENGGSLPDGWDDSNCAVYLSYDGEPTALARFDTYDAGTELFSEHYGLIPIGVEVHVIFVTESEGQWSYAVQAQTIVDNHLTVFASAEDLVETDADGLAAVINALP